MCLQEWVMVFLIKTPWKPATKIKFLPSQQTVVPSRGIVSVLQHQHRTDAQISTATVLPGEGSSVRKTGWLRDLAPRSTHCGSWVLAPCQAKQNLIPSAGKARPPLSNPMLSSLVVWSAHTAVPPCISPLGRKKTLLVGMSPRAPFMGLRHTHTKKVTWSQSIHWQDSKSQTDQQPSLYVFNLSWWSQKAALPTANVLSSIATVCEY